MDSKFGAPRLKRKWRTKPIGVRPKAMTRPSIPQKNVEYTCPMHPQIVRNGPGACPICGMALEPRQVSVDAEENTELRDMSRRFWISVAFTLPIFFLGMSELIPGQPIQHLISPHFSAWVQLVLASPVVLWG